MGSMMGYYYDAADYTAAVRGDDLPKAVSIGQAMEEQREMVIKEKERLLDEEMEAARQKKTKKKSSGSIFGPLRNGESQSTVSLDDASIFRVPDENQFKGDWKTPVNKEYEKMESAIVKKKKEEVKKVERALKSQLANIDKKKDGEFPTPTGDDTITDMRLMEKDRVMQQAQSKIDDLQQNEIYKIFMQDVNNHDHLHSQRMPWAMTQEITERLNTEAMRSCYELAKELSRCYQDKLYTSWKCRKQHNTYMRCIKIVKEDPAVKDQLIWKYKMGIYYQELRARDYIVASLWDAYWPDQEIGPGWVADNREWKREAMKNQMNK